MTIALVIQCNTAAQLKLQHYTYKFKKKLSTLEQISPGKETHGSAVSHACHFRNLASPGLRERFSVGTHIPRLETWFSFHGNENFPMNYRSQFGRDNGLTRNTEAAAKLKGPHISTGNPGMFSVPIILKLHFNPWVQRIGLLGEPVTR